MVDKYRVIKAEEVNLRSGPGTDFTSLSKIRKDEIGLWYETHKGLDGYDWHRMVFSGIDQFIHADMGWMRSDYLQKIPEFSVGTAGAMTAPSEAPIASTKTRWPLPCSGTFVQGFSNQFPDGHKGWDVADRIGSLIFAQPGGIVTQTEWCQKCGEAGLSSYGNDIPLRQIYSDKGWNGGFGHFVVVRYDESILPAETRSLFSGKHAYVLYGHMSKIVSAVGDLVQRSFVIGEMGNSGNSSGPHCHIELRFSDQKNMKWSQLHESSIDPGVLFTR